MPISKGNVILLRLAIFTKMPGVRRRSTFHRAHRAAMGVLAVACVSQCTSAEELKPSIVIPSITHKWKLPGDEAKAEITIDELSQCMGVNFRIKDRLSEIKQQQNSLEMEQLEIGAQLMPLQDQSAEIQRSQTVLEDSAKNLKNRAAELERRRTSIEKFRVQHKLSAAEVKNHNALVAAYNKDANENNKYNAALKLAANDLKAKIDKFNLTVEQHNNRVAQFNERNLTFRTLADRYNADIAKYQDQCAGERVLKK